MSEKPIGGRSSFPIVLFVLAAMAPAVASGEENTPLTEWDAVRRALDRPALADLARGEADAVRADTAAATRWPNPVVSWSREETHGGAPASTESYATVLQPIDVSGRRGLHREAGEQRLVAATSEAASRRVDAAAEARVRFYDTLHAQLRVGLTREWVDQIRRVERIVGKRETAGEVSGYDRRRLAREEAQADARLEAYRAAFDRATARLAALTGETLSASDEPVVSGDLLPPIAPPPLDALLATIDTRPDVRALDAEIAAAELDARAASRWWAPEVSLTGGVKAVEASGEHVDGYTAGFFFPLPVFDRQQAHALRGQGRARTARARRTLLVAEAAGDLRGAWAQASRLIAAARQLQKAASAESAALLQMAEAAYAEGELEILALLDAHRGALDASLQAIDLSLDARRATIEVDRLTGAGA